MKIIDLFCGAGGFSNGFSQAGLHVDRAFDYDEDAIKTYNQNHQGNAEKVDLTEYKPLELCGKDVDVVIGSPPCQQFSVANYYDRGGDKTNLVFVYADYVKQLEPEAFIMENVEGMASFDGIFRDLLNEFRDIGYTVNFEILNSEKFGVPQKRDRVFIVGFKEKKRFNFPDGGSKRVSVREAIGDLPSLESGESSSKYDNHVAPDHDDSTVEKIESTGIGRSVYDNWSEKKRLHPEKPSPTVKAGKRANFHFAHYEDDRGLTVREKARLQSFPDSFEFLGSITQQRKLVGNAVPPKVAKVLAERLESEIEREGEFVTLHDI